MGFVGSPIADGSLCQPQVASCLSVHVGLAYYTQALTDDLHKRLGELRDGQRSGASGELFLYYLGSNLTYQSNRNFSDYGVVQLGKQYAHSSACSGRL